MKQIIKQILLHPAGICVNAAYESSAIMAQIKS